MDTHKNARLTPKGREEMVRSVLDGGLSYTAGGAQGAREAPSFGIILNQGAASIRSSGSNGARCATFG